MVPKGLIFGILVVGIALAGFGLYAELALGLDPGNLDPTDDSEGELALDNQVGWAIASYDCDPGDPCPLSLGEYQPYGRYVGGYLISYRYCPKYYCDAWGSEAGCYCSKTGGPVADPPDSPEFASGFGILIFRSTSGNPSLLLPMPLDAISNADVSESIKDKLKIKYLDAGRDDSPRMFWVRYDLDGITSNPLTGSNYDYEFAELVGGCEDNEETIGTEENPCGNVYIEHAIKLKNPSYEGGVGGN